MMSIERTLPTQPVSPVGNIQKNKNDVTDTRGNTAPAKKQSAEYAGTQVTLSDVTRQIGHSSEKEINTARVEKIKDAISRGELTLDPEKIADALLSNATLFDD